jgi:hypothetical protein
VSEKHLAEEKAAVQALIRQLHERSGERSWAAFARQAGVSELSLGEWRRGEGMPGAVNPLRLLADAGVVTASFELPGLQANFVLGRGNEVPA